MTFQTTTRKGKKFALIPIEDMKQITAILMAADTSLPPFPPIALDGTSDAIEYGRVSLARKIITARRTAGLSQAELARRAGVRAETLNRIEKALVTADTATIIKVDRALKTAGKSKSKTQTS